MFKVGTVINYFEKTGIVLVELSNTLSVGDRIKFVDDRIDLFSQSVDSIKVGHRNIDSGNRGDMVLLKTNELVKTGTEIFKA